MIKRNPIRKRLVLGLETLNHLSLAAVAGARAKETAGRGSGCASHTCYSLCGQDQCLFEPSNATC